MLQHWEPILFASVLYHDPDLRSDGSARASSSLNVSMWENLNLTRFFSRDICFHLLSRWRWRACLGRIETAVPESAVTSSRHSRDVSRGKHSASQMWNIHMDVWSINAIYLHISGVFFTTQRCQMWPLVSSSSAALSLLGHEPLFWSWESTVLFSGQGAVYTGWANWIRDCRPLVYFN